MLFSDLLQQKKLSQRKLAKKLKLSQAAISLWVTGKCMPHLITMQKIAEILEVDLQTVINCFVDKTLKK